jgi:hypothetical protein
MTKIFISYVNQTQKSTQHKWKTEEKDKYTYRIIPKHSDKNFISASQIKSTNVAVPDCYGLLFLWPIKM